MINTFKIVLLTMLLLGNLFLLCVSAYYWKSGKNKASKVGFAYMTVLTLANMFVVGGVIL